MDIRDFFTAKENVFIALVIIGVIMAVVANILGLAAENQRLKKDLDYYRHTYLETSGTAMGFGDYHIASFDGGEHWYNVKYNKPGIMIEDSANPKLIAHIDGMQVLVDYATKNGPIGSKPITQKDIKILEGAGFSVKQAQGGVNK